MTTTRLPALGRADRGIITAFLVIGVFGGGFIAGLGIVTGIFRVLDPSGAPIALLADIPLERGAGIVEAHGDRLLVTPETLSAGPLWLLAIADILLALTIGIVTASITFVLVRVLQRKLFHRTMQTALVAAGGTIAIGSLLHQGARGFGQAFAADELNPALGGVATPGFEISMIFPVLVGLGIVALAYVFRAGNRLQRETEGLV
ncbi:MAG: hypothetical protein D3X82_08825 [Candidatus Leucobacter sulfamidivorax]|nr:hypothetical protein [Candidatus Leucobacter sulfamidivorax]